MSKFRFVVFFNLTLTLFLGGSLVACRGSDPVPAQSPEKRAPQTAVSETPVTPIPLLPPLDQAAAEISGMAWYGEHLILLPQYPDFARSEDDGAVYALDRADLLAYLDGEGNEPPPITAVPLHAPGVIDRVDGFFEGYEAIAFAGETAYLTIEARTLTGMIGYLLQGHIEPDLSGLRLEADSLTELPPQTEIGNLSDEALLPGEGEVLTIYEANGTAVNPDPVARRFGPDLQARGTISFPNIPYRITDVTELDANGRFWAINYFFPDTEELAVERDPLAETYGVGASHAGRAGVERLVQMAYNGEEVTMVAQSPIQLELLEGELRNWEGIVRLNGRGFLLVTDKFPTTILGFVPVK